MEQLVIILVIALISLINWAIQKSAEQRERRRQASTIETGRQAEGPVAAPRPEPTVSEQMRKLMEALGLPEDASLPEPKRRKPVPPPVVAPPPIPDLERRVTTIKVRLPESHAPAPAPVEPRAPNVAARQDRSHMRVPEAAKPLPSKSRLRRMLASAEGLQSAVVLREVLGKPRGLRVD